MILFIFAIGMEKRPLIAIADTNTLTCLGLAGIIRSMMPMVDVKFFHSSEEMRNSGIADFYHYFVSVHVLMEDPSFFMGQRHKTIVITSKSDNPLLPAGFHTLNVNQSEERLIKDFLRMEQYAHGGGRNMPEEVSREVAVCREQHVLTSREIEVLQSIVRGNINKEIAELLHISLTTVISHRKNLIEKLGIKSVSGLTIYAVMNGYVQVDEI